MAVRYGWTLLGTMLCLMGSAVGAEKEFKIVIKDHHFVPAELQIPAGEKVRIIVDNQDDSPEEFESYSLDREKHIPAKSQIVLYLGPLGAGRYVYQGEDRTNGGGAALGVVEAR